MVCDSLMDEKCKVIGCENHVMEIKDSARCESMKGLYGYCQIHNIEGLVTETIQKGKVAE